MAGTSAHLAGLVGVPVHSARSVFVGGLLGSLFSLLQLAVSPLVGWAADRYGRRPVALLSAVCVRAPGGRTAHVPTYAGSRRRVQAGTVAAHVVWLFAGTFELFVLARVLGGATRALVQLAVAIVADVTGPDHRARGMVRPAPHRLHRIN
jgi:MFS family permease